jgi:hypothetical protein
MSEHYYGRHTIYVFHIGEDNTYEWSEFNVPGSVPIELTYDEFIDLHNLQIKYNRQQDKFAKIVKEAQNG